ncbi:hypothetical protein RJ639_047833 [Escallonia herrerae]|uniref:Uncharacterized protein n=1 Tax=Escallonia herrerae TaxID=1293975 RepID=A0AA89B0K7_9ASTE|nr:hypothetical protein RJ639_047833 [Escallonia herrerae]
MVYFSVYEVCKEAVLRQEVEHFKGGSGDGDTIDLVVFGDGSTPVGQGMKPIAINFFDFTEKLAMT